MKNAKQSRKTDPLNSRSIRRECSQYSKKEPVCFLKQKQLFGLKLDESQRDHQRLIHSCHQLIVKMSDLIGQPLLINRADLL
jgi:hypothetical protein